MNHDSKTEGKKRLRIGEFLLLSGMINQKTLDHALHLQKTQKKKLGQILVELGVIDDVVVAKALSWQLRIPCIRLVNLSISPEAVSMVPAAIARKNLIVPTQIKEKGLIVAMANPIERQVITSLRGSIQMSIEIRVAPETDILQVLSKYYPEKDDSAKPIPKACKPDATGSYPHAGDRKEKDLSFREAEEKGSKSILVVDDNEVIRVTMEKILQFENYHVRTARNGLEAMESVSKHKPDLIITDYLMPEMDGLTLIRHLKSQAATRLIPIIMITVKDEIDTEVGAIEAGADDYLTKPINRKRFVARVNRIFQRGEVGQGKIAPAGKNREG